MISPALSYLLLFLSFSCIFALGNHENFVQCISTRSPNPNIKYSRIIHSPSTPTYTCLLKLAQQNPRWLNSTESKPQFIVTPYTTSDVQAAVLCSKTHGLRIRVKSGGHDYEGLSYLCKTPFVLIDLINLHSISIDLQDETAWVQSGATLGELYYHIAMKSGVHGFPAGLCPSVGVGGHFSGGGFGTLLRKHGLAADNIVDACLIDADGKILDRESMGEDLFWAIRGGGGASFGIIIAWKIRLVRVPPVVTVFTVSKHLDQEGIKLVHKWQNIANNLPEDLFIRVVVQYFGGEQNKIEVLFNSLFLGPVTELVPLMNKAFPEISLLDKDCKEMSWIESVLYFAGFQKGDCLHVLLNRTVQYKSNFKAKSDFVEKPIPEIAWEGIREFFLQEQTAFMIMDPFGGRMERIPDSELPFPHRKGNLYNIQYLVKWTEDGEAESVKHVDWIKRLHEYMKPHVSSYPRSAYVNYRDLDLGINEHQNASYAQALRWGRNYFKGNFERLARAKTRADPENFFRNEQSIPLLH